MQRFVLLSQSSIIIRCAKAIEHGAEELRVRIFTNFLSHVARSYEHLVEHMKITVQASYVRCGNFCIVNEAAVLAIIPCLVSTIQVKNERDIAWCDILFIHLSLEEVSHHRRGFVQCHINTLARIARIGVTVPKTLVGCFTRRLVQVVR